MSLGSGEQHRHHRFETLIALPPLWLDMEARNLPEIEMPPGIDSDSTKARQFVESATNLIKARLHHNRQAARDVKNIAIGAEDVLAYDNTRSLDIRAEPLHNPRVILWLNDCPVWANDSWSETFHPYVDTHKKEVTTVTFDVRPFL